MNAADAELPLEFLQPRTQPNELRRDFGKRQSLLATDTGSRSTSPRQKRVAPGTVGNSPVEPRLPTHRDHLGDQLLRHSRRRPTIAPPVSAKDSKKRARPSPVKRRFVFLDGSIRASVSLSLNGWRRRLSVSCVGLCLGLIARDTFGPPSAPSPQIPSRPSHE